MQKLNEASLQKIDEIVARHKGQPGPVKMMLHEVQDDLGYIPFEAMEKIADAAGVSVAEVYGVVTFYTRFKTQPGGKHVINVCLGTACYVNNAQTLLDKILELTQSPVNGTSADGLFSVDATRCLGACGLAPVAVIDGKVYGQALKTGSAEKRLKEIMAAERHA
jgi:NADH:ubiquinone oxidoreductase subunit E